MRSSSSRHWGHVRWSWLAGCRVNRRFRRENSRMRSQRRVVKSSVCKTNARRSAGFRGPGARLDPFKEVAQFLAAEVRYRSCSIATVRSRMIVPRTWDSSSSGCCSRIRRGRREQSPLLPFPVFRFAPRGDRSFVSRVNQPAHCALHTPALRHRSDLLAYVVLSVAASNRANRRTEHPRRAHSTFAHCSSPSASYRRRYRSRASAPSGR